MKISLNTRQPIRIKEEIEKLAKKNKRSLTQEVELALESYINKNTRK